ncbi:MAG: DUF2752 domain-containing protein [Prevotellaceae bacterium]|nr:DUF2752 domain-containing protein [Prevotellaceae bacterium]
MKRLTIAVSCLIVLVVLFFVNPEHTVWLPKCLFHQLTGLQCPACGTQRAMHQLLHLNVVAAFRCNPFLLVSLPYISALVFFRRFYSGGKLQQLRRLCFSTATVNIYLILLVLWCVVRNLLPLFGAVFATAC